MRPCLSSKCWRKCQVWYLNRHLLANYCQALTDGPLGFRTNRGNEGKICPGTLNIELDSLKSPAHWSVDSHPHKVYPSISDCMNVKSLWGTIPWSDLSLCIYVGTHPYILQYPTSREQTLHQSQRLAFGTQEAGFKFYLCGLPILTMYSISSCLKLNSFLVLAT